MRSLCLCAASLILIGSALLAGTVEEHLPKHLLGAPRIILPYDFSRDLLPPRGGAVRLKVDYRSGTVTSAEIQISTGSTILDEDAIHTLRHWRFQPGTTSHVEVPVRFTASGVFFWTCAEESNHAMELTASRRTAEISVTSTFSAVAMRAVARSS